MSRMGRRGKYHEWLTKDGLTKLEGWARDGLVDTQIAKNIGIAPGTLYEWKKRYPEIDESLKRGKEVIDFEVENALLKRALGYEYEEVKTIVEKDEMGKDRKRQERVLKHVPPDSTSIIYWLKNRKPDVWQQVNSELRERTKAETRRANAEAELAEYKAKEEAKAKEPMEVIIVDDLKDVMDDAGD